MITAYVCIYIGSRCSSNVVQDVVFVIEANFYNKSSFEQMKKFVVTITTELIHNSPQTAVGVILSGYEPYIYFNLQAYTSLNTLIMAINELPYHERSGVYLERGLGLLLSSAQYGTLGLRNNTSKVAIVITERRPYNILETLSAADALHSLNIFDIYAIGSADVRQLKSIASSPEFVYSVSSFTSTGLQQIKDEILPQLCNGKYYICMYIDLHKRGTWNT